MAWLARDARVVGPEDGDRNQQQGLHLPTVVEGTWALLDMGEYVFSFPLQEVQRPLNFCFFTATHSVKEIIVPTPTSLAIKEENQR